MSLSSGTTLISPSATTASGRSAHTQPGVGQRRPSQHSAHPHAAGHVKRRASHHHVAHAHSSHSHHGHAGPSNNRRSSDEGGRRALAAGLAMHVLDSATELSDDRSKLPKSQRPVTKASRSDTHLPRLSRTASVTSEASGSSGGHQQRPKKGRNRSGESVQVLSEDGRESGEAVDPEEEGWESGEGEDDDNKGKGKEKKEGKKAKDQDISPSTAMRRTVSDTQAEVVPKSGLVSPPVAMPEAHTAALTQRTTGFAGVQTPAADPTLEAQAHHNVVTPHWNDPTHIMPAHQIRHQQSARSINIAAGANPGSHQTLSAMDGEKTPKPGSVARTGAENKPPAPASPPPQGPSRMRSTEGSGLADSSHVKTSPSFPFPKVVSPTSPLSQQQVIPSGGSDPFSAKQGQHGQPRAQAPPPEQQRHRLASGTEPPRLRHRYSNSSLRSIQSLRAPPHPLNSPTGFRTGLPTVATSRPGSAFNSPSKGEKRGPNMHYPPMAAPVVNREVIKGEGWPIIEEQESTAPGPSNGVNGHGNTNGPNGPSGPSSISTMRGDRKSSVSSQASLAGVLNSSRLRHNQSPASSITVPPQPPQPARRKTAREVASAAAKLPTTNDPVAYHHSLGYPSTSAETAHLISRFLPQRKTRRPEWDISVNDPKARRNSVDDEEELRIGLTRGDYRDAHESLIRMMKDISMPVNGVGKRVASRTLSYQTLLGTGSSSGSGGSGQEDGKVLGLGSGLGVGTTQGRNGTTMVVAKGGWRGRTPFELSVERCLAQRPQRAMSGL